MYTGNIKSISPEMERLLETPGNPADVNPGISKRRYSNTHGSPASMGSSIMRPLSFSTCPIIVRIANGTVTIAQMIKKVRNCFLVSKSVFM